MIEVQSLSIPQGTSSDYDKHLCQVIWKWVDEWQSNDRDKNFITRKIVTLTLKISV